MLLAQVTLTGAVASYQDSLADMSLLDATNYVNYAVIGVTGFGFFIVLLSMLRNYKFTPMLAALTVSLTFSIIFLCMGSQLWLFLFHPEVFGNADQVLKFAKFLSYPSLVSLVLVDMQPIWIISTGLSWGLFNLAFNAIDTGGDA